MQLLFLLTVFRSRALSLFGRADQRIDDASRGEDQCAVSPIKCPVSEPVSHHTSEYRPQNVSCVLPDKASTADDAGPLLPHLFHTVRLDSLRTCGHPHGLETG